MDRYRRTVFPGGSLHFVHCNSVSLLFKETFNYQQPVNTLVYPQETIKNYQYRTALSLNSITTTT